MNRRERETGAQRIEMHFVNICLANTGDTHPRSRGRKMAFRRDAFSDPMMEAPLRRIKAWSPPPPSRDHLFLYTRRSRIRMIKHSWNFAPLPLFINPDLASPRRTMDGCCSIRGKSDLENFALARWFLLHIANKFAKLLLETVKCVLI